MTRIDLFVPYDEKDKAKALGAKWDTASKLWYIPTGVDPSPFEKWRSNPLTIPNVRCNRFYIATATQNCGKCSAPVKMVTFVLPRGWEEWVTADDGVEAHWQMNEYDVILNGVNWACETASKAINKFSSHYKLVRKVYLNHCEKCGESQEEPDSGNTHIFKPEAVEQAKQITLHYYQEPFECRCYYQDVLYCHYGSNAFDLMKLDE